MKGTKIGLNKLILSYERTRQGFLILLPHLRKGFHWAK
jgi:hypothetical protein